MPDDTFSISSSLAFIALTVSSLADDMSSILVSKSANAAATTSDTSSSAADVSNLTIPSVLFLIDRDSTPSR